MRKEVSCGAMVLLALGVMAPAVAAQTGATGPSIERERLERRVKGQFELETSPANGAASFARVRRGGDLMPGPWAAKGKVFLREHGRLFGLNNAERELVEMSDKTDEIGQRTVTYQQLHDGVPVFGARFKTSVDKAGRLTRANGSLLPSPAVSVVPNLAASDAGARAVAHLRRSASPRDLGAVTPSPGKLFVYNAGFVRHRAGLDQLVYEVEVNGDKLREFVYVDAHSGKIVDQITGIYDAIDRNIYEGGFGSSFRVWQEGNSTPTGTPAWDNLIDFSLDTYNLASSISNGAYLSWDGVDGTMHAVNNDPAISCPNAQFTGSTIRFCNGTTTDDIVGHEWFHGYTQETHGLIYLNQSGALNEAYSDIFGEVVDFLNGDVAGSPNAPRSAQSCSVYGGVGLPSLTVTSPAEVAGAYAVGDASFNPAGTAPVTGTVVAASPNDGCSAVSATVSGNIALIDRGNCPFATKVLNAQLAGAAGVIIANNAGDDVILMGGTAAGITIPSVSVGQSDGTALRNASNVSATLALGSAADDSVRWLTGEDASAFGGAIRDMWAPNCFGDPGRVSDPLYACDPTGADAGGVHSNSGIINHGFALLVDGGAYNGQTIAAIGLTKAAHLYWRAMTTYQTPVSGYADHAAALQSSCEDLTGEDLYALSTDQGVTGPSGEVITATDCAQVDNMVLALELYQSPTQCGFATLLAQEPPALCAPGEAASGVLDEGFGNGLNGWIAGSRAIVNPSTFDVPDWTVTGNLPFGRPGQAAFGANPVIGNCGTDIEAGVTFLQSPAFTVPVGGRLVFEHSLSTEKNYDGGNLKISVNGGSYQLIAASAFDYNAYNGALYSYPNDNPIAGEAAFHGSDGGTLQSAFGESHVDLSAVASPGDQVTLRFEMGSDGCNGLVGWYVDRVRAFSCEPDFDGDGVPDASDADDDNDGVPDVNDAFPYDVDEWNDNDNDGSGDNADPDDDNDGIEDPLDSEPFLASNECTAGDDFNATLTLVAVLTNELTCAARQTISVNPPTEVQDPGHLILIAPSVSFQSGFKATRLTVTSADPCPDC